ncbi:MAG: nitrilase-related carbon-nitrogen hydrolase [Thermodesulfobacteriota bacterium]|jgi:apolipoprotein N-acyltransferase
MEQNKIQTERLSWLWLLIGVLLVPFVTWQTVIPLAAWFAPVFLLRFSRTSRRTFVALPLIFVAYFVGNLIAGRGLPFNLLGFIGNIIFKALVWTLPYAADRALHKRLGERPRLLIFPLAFTTVDWILSLLKVSGTASPAYSQFDNLALIQIVSITGMWGVTFLIMWFASAANALWEHDFDWRPVSGIVGLFLAVLVATQLFGSIRLTFTPPSSQTVQVATITADGTISQAAIDKINWMTFNRSTDAERAAVRPRFEATVKEMLARTETALKGGAKIASWQEEAAWVLAEDERGTVERAAALARQYNAYVQVSLGVFTRTDRLPYLLDRSILIDNKGQSLWTYDKKYPVPYDEAFVTIAGKSPLPYVDTPYGRMSASICWETYYPARVRQAGKNGADILFAPSNDVAPFALSASVMFVYRAIENGFSLVRPTGKGISLITDYEGRVLGSQDYFTNKSGIMLTSIPIRGVRTVYSQIGDIFAYMCVAGLIFLTGWVIVRREKSAEVVRPKAL